MEERLFKKGDIIRAWQCDEQGRVMATVEIEGKWIANPSIAKLLSDGWQELEADNQESYNG